MANHDGTGTGWNTAAPSSDQPHGRDYIELQDLRKGVGLRASKEHETYAASSAGGEHKAGSAKIYNGDYSVSSAGDNLPTTRPDGTTALDSDDAGRLAYDTNATYGGIWYRYTGSGWEVVTWEFTDISAATKDEDNMASDSATHVPTQQSVKAYVDSNVGSANFTPTSEAGATGSEGYTLLPNGLRIAYGSVSVAGNTDETVSLSGWSAIYTAVPAYMENNNTDRGNGPKIKTLGSNSFVVRNMSLATLHINYIAIGR